MRLDRYVSTVYYFLTALAHCCFSYTRMHAKSTKKRKKKLRPVIGTYKPKLFPTQITTIIIRFIYHEFDSAILSCILAIVHRKLFFLPKLYVSCHHLKFVTISDGGNSIHYFQSARNYMSRTVLKTIGGTHQQSTTLWAIS